MGKAGQDIQAIPWNHYTRLVNVPQGGYFYKRVAKQLLRFRNSFMMNHTGCFPAELSMIDYSKSYVTLCGQ